MARKTSQYQLKTEIETIILENSIGVQKIVKIIKEAERITSFKVLHLNIISTRALLKYMNTIEIAIKSIKQLLF